ncbi:MAG: hypothetical protein IKH16_07605 [Selenomonadaceae bacterium]|nr:hypothetical protein [Selenomonadaceae bacterium]
MGDEGMATIAILNNSEEAREGIKKTLLARSANKDSLEFVEYSLKGRHKADLMAAVDGDVQADAIQLLIAGDFLDTGWEEFSSADLIAFCHRATPGFPYIILTEAEIADSELENILSTHIFPASHFLGEDSELSGKLVAEIDRLCAGK